MEIFRGYGLQKIPMMNDVAPRLGSKFRAVIGVRLPFGVGTERVKVLSLMQLKSIEFNTVKKYCIYYIKIMFSNCR